MKNMAVTANPKDPTLNTAAATTPSLRRAITKTQATVAAQLAATKDSKGVTSPAHEEDKTSTRTPTKYGCANAALTDRAWRASQRATHQNFQKYTSAAVVNKKNAAPANLASGRSLSTTAAT